MLELLSATSQILNSQPVAAVQEFTGWKTWSLRLSFPPNPPVCTFPLRHCHRTWRYQPVTKVKSNIHVELLFCPGISGNFNISLVRCIQCRISVPKERKQNTIGTVDFGHIVPAWNVLLLKSGVSVRAASNARR